MSLKTRIDKLEKRFYEESGFGRRERRKRYLDNVISKLPKDRIIAFVDECSDEDREIILGLPEGYADAMKKEFDKL